MADHITCPCQSESDFSADGYFSCRYFEMNIGTHTSFNCKKQKDRPHKKAFTSVMIANSIGLPVSVKIDKDGVGNG